MTVEEWVVMVEEDRWRATWKMKKRPLGEEGEKEKKKKPDGAEKKASRLGDGLVSYGMV